MKMRNVTHNEFHHILEITDAELTGSDVGRTHGIFQYTRQGRVVGVESWMKVDGERYWVWEIANYLCEAYLREKADGN